MKKIIFLFLTAAIQWHCTKENAPPTFISITGFNVAVKSGEGSASNKITDAHVFVNGSSLGVYPLPTIFPIVDTGNIQLDIFAGIRNNGIKSNPIMYPFYSKINKIVPSQSGKTIVLNPTLQYNADAKFWLTDNFEVTNSFTVNYDNNAAIKFTTVPNGFEGRSAQIILTKDQPAFEKASAVKAQLPVGAQNVFIELNYKTDTPLAVGLWGTTFADPAGTTTYKITLFPNKEWNKTYINVTNEAKDLARTDYQVILKGILPDSLSTATVLIDNVKLIQN